MQNLVKYFENEHISTAEAFLLGLQDQHMTVRQKLHDSVFRHFANDP